MAATVILKVIGNAASGVAAMRSVQGEIDKVTKATKVLGAAFTALSAVGGKFIRDAAMTAARTQVLGTSLKVVAEQAGYSEGQIAKLEEEIKGLGITTQNTRQGIIRLIQSQVDLSKAGELARTAQDLAVIAGENSSDTYARLVRAIATMNPRLLRMTGIVANLNDVFGEHASKLDPVTKKQMLLDFILKEGEKVSGVYAMAMGDVGKALTSLPRYFEELRNAIGKHFLPILKIGVDLLSNFLKWFTALPEPVQKVIAILIGAGTALSGLAGVMLLFVGFLPAIISGFTALLGILPALLPVLAGVAGAIAAMVAAGALLAKAWKENWAGIQITVHQAVRRIKKLIEPIVEDIRFWLAEIKKAWTDFVAAVRPIVESIIDFIREKLLFGSGLPEFVSFLRDAINVVLGLVRSFLQSLTAAIKGEEDAWEPLYDGFLNVMTLIALAWEKWISKALTWGWNMIVEVATGMAQAAKGVLSTVLTEIGNVIRSFLGAFSPPKKGPLARITEWGRNLIDEYIHAFTLADFGAIRSALAPIQEALESAVRVGDISEADMVGIFQQVRGLAAQLFADFRETGRISEEVLGQIGDALGEGAQDYLDYIRLTLEHQAALDNLRSVEEEVTAARERGYVPKELQDRLDAAKGEVDAKKEAVDWQRELLAFQQESVDMQARLVAAMEDLTKAMTGVGGIEGVAGGVTDLAGALDEIAAIPPIDLKGKMGLGELSQEFLDMKERVKEFFENLPGQVLTWVEKARVSLLRKWDEIKAGVAEKWTEITDEIERSAMMIAAIVLAWLLKQYLTITQWWDDIKTAISDKWVEITEAVETSALMITAIVLAWLLGIYNGMILWWEDIKTAVSDAWQGIVDTISEWIDEAILTVTNAVDDWIQAGKDLIGGLLEGLMSAWADVRQWIGDRIEDLPGWLKDALGIASPPQWAIDAGQDIVAGLREGLDLSSLQSQIGAAINVEGFGGRGGGGTVVFADGAFSGAFPGVRDGRDAGSVMTEIQRLVEQGYLKAQVPGGVTV